MGCKQAASSSGGKYGKGGDILYRWGNPRAYGRGEKSDQKLFGQHDPQWIPNGYPGAGNILIFNNGWGRPEGSYSTVVEITPPFTAAAGFYGSQGKVYGPNELTWEFRAPKRDFFSQRLSGAIRTTNGNTLICSGNPGTIFEVTQNGSRVWQYKNPFGGSRSQQLTDTTSSKSSIPKGSTPLSRRSSIKRTPESTSIPIDEMPNPSSGIRFGGKSVFKAPWYPMDYPGIQLDQR